MMQAIQDVLHSEGFDSADALAESWAILVAMSKVEQYKAEVEFFEKKYQSGLNKFQQKNLSQDRVEDFQQEDDLDDWEFATQACTIWRHRLERLQNWS